LLLKYQIKTCAEYQHLSNKNAVFVFQIYI
jgi:hypothetical protein